VLDRSRLEPAPRAFRLTPEAVAAVCIAWAMWYLAGHWGGVDVRDAVRGLAPLLVSLPAAALGLGMIGSRWAAVVAALAAGMAASVVFAAFRSDAAAPLLTYGAMMIVGPATIAIWRRSWGPTVLAAVAVAAGARAWWVGFEAWYGGSLDGTVDRWLSLPWHNQSGVLMAAMAVALGVAAATAARRTIPWALGAALAAAACYLSGSRGSLIALAIGVAAGVAVSRRYLRWLAMAAGAVVIAAALGALGDGGAGGMDGSLPAVESGSARLAHWSAAIAMLVDDPVTGQGIGSYRLASPRWAPGSVNPSSHAHNEFIELFAEGGLAVGVPGLLLMAAMAVAALRVLGARNSDRVAQAAAASWLTLAAHAFVDFDWLFPVLAVALAVAGGAVVGSRPPKAGRRWPVAVVGVVAAAAVVAGVWAGFGDGGAPWNADAAAARAEQAVDTGDVQRAIAISAEAARWNPGDPRPALWAAVARIDRDGPRPVVAAADAATPGFALRLAAASALIDAGHHQEAAALIDGVIGDFDAYAGWNLGGAAAVAYRLDVDVTGQIAGCVPAREAAIAAAATPLATGFGAEDYVARAERYCDQ
jgi:O-antigen ligase